MSLNRQALEDALYTQFESMVTLRENANIFLGNCINSCVASYVAAGLTQTTDAGSGISPPGTYTGSSSKVGAYVYSSGLNTSLTAAFDDMALLREETGRDPETGAILYKFYFADEDHTPPDQYNELLSKGMADAFHKHFSADNTISTTTIGEIETSSSVVSASASATGKLSGSRDVMYATLLSGLRTITGTDGSSRPFARLLSNVIHSYLTSAVVSIQYSSPQIVGTGTGSIS